MVWLAGFVTLKCKSLWMAADTCLLLLLLLLLLWNIFFEDARSHVMRFGNGSSSYSMLWLSVAWLTCMLHCPMFSACHTLNKQSAIVAPVVMM